jgi:hypothetical protein
VVSKTAIGGEQMKVYKIILITLIKKKEGSIFSKFLNNKIEIPEYKKFQRKSLMKDKN